jgi:hypothetical protein
MTASLMAYMQHTEEQWALSHLFMSREPTHWNQAIFWGSRPSLERRLTWPAVGPEAERMRSNSIAVTTLGRRAYW